ncbi:unnamed protein product [Toxocara canis]|uniref:OMP_b-brl_2 domain-containing protein n=1 Tax=Toxocara canis TaxID=6265 RepID=A0A183UGI7_TOXCA|nr:unnamed protein product [Toxocara canis]
MPLSEYASASYMIFLPSVERQKMLKSVTLYKADEPNDNVCHAYSMNQSYLGLEFGQQWRLPFAVRLDVHQGFRYTNFSFFSYTLAISSYP